VLALDIITKLGILLWNKNLMELVFLKTAKAYILQEIWPMLKYKNSTWYQIIKLRCGYLIRLHINLNKF